MGLGLLRQPIMFYSAVVILYLRGKIYFILLYVTKNAEGTGRRFRSGTDADVFSLI